MCGDIMIQSNKMKQRKQPSHAFVVSMMCAVVVTIVAQSLDIPNMWSLSQEGDKAYASDHPLGYHGVASDDSWSQWNVRKQLDNLVDAQKQQIDNYIYGLLWWSKWVKDLWWGHGDDHPHTPHIPWKKDEETEKNTDENTSKLELPPQSDYTSFDVLQNQLLQKKCNYTLPIDNTDTETAAIIQRWLDHCLVTVSQSYKVYPMDILTHEMMRTIADRAGFAVKMEYASSKAVSREQLFSFLNALQQNHNIWNMPVVVVSNPVKRIDYLVLLKKLFEQWIPLQESEEIHFVEKDTSTINDIIIQNSENEVNTSSESSSLWVDKEMLKSTVAWIIDKI